MQPQASGLKAAGISMSAAALTPNEGAKLIEKAYLAGKYKRTICARSSPGIGKTSMARQAADELAKHYPGFDYIEINPTMPADEVCGLPDLIRKEGEATVTDYALPKWFPRDPKWRGIICLDDGLQGDRMMQQTIANLLQARNLRGHELPEGAMLMVTGNRTEDKAGVTKLLTHLADRMCFVDIMCEAKSWIEDFAIPKGLNEKVIAFITMFNEKLNNFNPNQEKCATPRTWEAVSNWVDMLDALPKSAERNKLAQVLLAGEIGVGMANEFWAFCNLFGQLPDPMTLLADPENANINYPIDVQYALAIAIAGKVDVSNVGAAITYVNRLGPDFVTLLMKIACRRIPGLHKAKEAQSWLANSANIFQK